jgi:hypothetical protein
MNETGASSCETCDVGTYAANTGQALCEPCPTGQANQGVGSASCVDCPVRPWSDCLSMRGDTVRSVAHPLLSVDTCVLVSLF